MVPIQLPLWLPLNQLILRMRIPPPALTHRISSPVRNSLCIESLYLEPGLGYKSTMYCMYVAYAAACKYCRACMNYEVERQRHNKQVNYTQDSSFFKHAHTL